MSRLKMADLGNQWEDLRKQARHLENEIDLKLVSFSKLGTNYSNHLSANQSDSTPLLGKTQSVDHMFETMAMEIEQLLGKLTGVNDLMADYTQNLRGNSGSAALLHTLQRHRDILQDYSHEFQKTRTTISSYREREDLLGSVRRDIDAFKNSSNRNSELYLKEHEHIRNSDRLIEEQINVALATKENLSAQRGFLKNISQKVNVVSNKFPLINNLIQKTNLRKRRDSIILGLVISICIILLLLYAFH